MAKSAAECECETCVPNLEEHREAYVDSGIVKGVIACPDAVCEKGEVPKLSNEI